MNYNPYYFTPYMGTAKTGLFSGLFKGIGGIKWSGILSGTQKVLNIANQTIPMIKQVSPMINNAKTMFKVMNEFKKTDIPSVNKVSSEKVNAPALNNSNDIGPTFFI